ncbi:hypothetical protein HYDPIDRAFT_90918 [Hydnomerulius pinastri MD-312]|uniref:MYND-type domain-containing protein n=1 Tax=Hydnomerulius pinastri MD-312 TaxID=994086 RepID=A0A0C9WEV0_9AGAM|nr:hypothetical protein HYDPIDRAFT_90918 [Hydnomerulius pinastri MD-312]
MCKIMEQPGFISIKMGSEALRKMLQVEFRKLDVNQLRPFARACFLGDINIVSKAVLDGTAPDLTGTETPFKLGYNTLTVLGVQRVTADVPDTLKHMDVLKCLLRSNASLDVPDVIGHTALHHACTSPHPHFEAAKVLLENGANVNAQNRYGELPVILPMTGGDVKLTTLLLERGADLDIPDANGDTPSKLAVLFGPQISAVAQRWGRKKTGETAPWEKRQCENCKAKANGLMRCARCRVVRYCSTECQRAHWKAHKPQCQSFSTATTVTLKPELREVPVLGSVSELTREYLGVATPNSRAKPAPGLRPISLASRNMVIKVQLPIESYASLAPSASGELLVYTKKRDFLCTVPRLGNEKAWDAIAQKIRSAGVRGVKAYFAAELKSPSELVVKIADVLAEQPF